METVKKINIGATEMKQELVGEPSSIEIGNPRKMKNDLKAGVIGIGYVSRSHLRALSRIPNVTTQAICDIRSEVLAKTAQEWGVPKSYTDYNDMIEREQLDFITICTPPHTHRPISVKAIKSGVHTLIEKPFTETEKEAQLILNAVKETNGAVKVGVVHNLLFTPTLRAGRRIFNHIGQLLNVILIKTGRFTEDLYMVDKDHWCHKMPGGRISECLPHFVYLTQEFMNDYKVRDVQGRRLSDAPWVSFDEVRITLEADSALGSIYWSRNTETSQCLIYLIGTEGTLKIRLDTGTLVKTRRPRRAWETLSEIGQLTSSSIRHFGRELPRLFGWGTIPHDRCINSFVQSIRNNQEPYVNAQKGYNCTRIAEEISTRLENLRIASYH